MLAGELQNSSFSSPEYMQDVWTKLTTMNMNTVLGSMSWEQIEPTEDSFDFTALDQVLVDARAHGLHVVLLWFGSFKNGKYYFLSSYAPRGTFIALILCGMQLYIVMAHNATMLHYAIEVQRLPDQKDI